MKFLEQKWYLFAVVIVCIVTLIGLNVFLQEEEHQDDLFADVTDAFADGEQDAEKEIEVPIKETVKKVDVKGAVKSPGLYIAVDGERVLDLVEKAGGFVAEADLNRVNLAQIVEDQMVIYVPRVGEEQENIPLQAGTGIGAGSSQESQKVNINTASESELQTLTGIGPSKAATIIQYRTEKGPFKSIEEIKNIGGIGDKTFEKLKDDIEI